MESFLLRKVTNGPGTVCLSIYLIKTSIGYYVHNCYI